MSAWESRSHRDREGANTITEFIAARAAESWSEARDRELLAGLDESRGTREADAMRAILAEHAPESKTGWRMPRCQRCISSRGSYQEDWSGDRYPCLTVRNLAAIDSDHPDYLPEWAPEAADVY